MFLSLGVVACGVAAAFLLSSSLDHATYALFAGIGGILLIILLFTHVIHAECPSCGQPAKLDMGGSFKYRCTACGHVHDTGISSSPD